MNLTLIPIVVAVVAGLFSLFGAFIGTWLGRRTEHEKWLRQNRSETYAKFLVMLSEARSCATDVRFDTTLEPLDRSIKMTECYVKPLSYAQVVRLFLPKTDRQNFIQLVEAYRAIHTDSDLSGSRYKLLEDKLAEIQKIFEISLEK